MQSIHSILNNLPQISNKIISTPGFCVWICWRDGPDSYISQILEESGGLEIARNPHQSLWFFFSVEVTFYALSRVDVWGKQMAAGVTAFTFPGELIVGQRQTLRVEFDQIFEDITTENPKSLVYIYTHPILCPYATSLPNISFYDMTSLEKQGLLGWKMLVADSRLPLAAEQGWFAFLHCVGNPINKQYQKGWEKIFTEIKPFIQEHKLKTSILNGSLSVILTNIQQLRGWVEQLLIIFAEIRDHHQDIYWPCLSLVMDKKNLSFTTDLHEKLNIDWSALAPDTPYLNYKNAFLLGNKFTILDCYSYSIAVDISALCTVGLSNLFALQSNFNPLIAKALMPAENVCFYCGSSYHDAVECPTKYLEGVPPNFWKELKLLDFSEINNHYQAIDSDINKYGIKAYTTLLENDNTTSKLLTATFAINSHCQLSNIGRVWQITSRDMDEVPEKAPPNKEPAWNILRRFTKEGQDIYAIERECLSHIATNPKDWHLHCLRGFISMEKKDYHAALSAWRDAENICSITTHQVWIKFLIARLREIQGFYGDAIDLYAQAQHLLPAWKDLEYRINVCLVKQGFGQDVTHKFLQKLPESPELFHKILVDPELKRGHFHILSQLIPEWEHAYDGFIIDRDTLKQLLHTLKEWFAETDNPMIFYGAQITALLEIGVIKNYLHFLELSTFKEQFEADLTRVIDQEINDTKQEYESCLSQVELIRDEMNWFYFQKALVNFNATFNDCASILNWAFVSDFKEVATYKEARAKLPKLKELTQKLSSKLSTLRLIRDITLFILLMLKTFMRTVIVLGILAVILILVLTFAGDSLGIPSIQSIMRINFLGIINVVGSITLMLSLGLASLKTTLVFDKRRNELLTNAKEERLNVQKLRIKKLKDQRIEEARAKAKRKTSRQRHIEKI